MKRVFIVLLLIFISLTMFGEEIHESVVEMYLNIFFRAQQEDINVAIILKNAALGDIKTGNDPIEILGKVRDFIVTCPSQCVLIEGAYYNGVTWIGGFFYISYSNIAVVRTNEHIQHWGL